MQPQGLAPWLTHQPKTSRSSWLWKVGCGLWICQAVVGVRGSLCVEVCAVCVLLAVGLDTLCVSLCAYCKFGLKAETATAQVCCVSSHALCSASDGRSGQQSAGADRSWAVHFYGPHWGVENVGRGVYGSCTCLFSGAPSTRPIITLICVQVELRVRSELKLNAGALSCSFC